MLSFQIDTMILNWSFTINSTTSNCPSLQAICNRVFRYVRTFNRYSRVINETFFGIFCHCGYKGIRKPISSALGSVIQLSGLYVGILDGGKQSLTAR